MTRVKTFLGIALTLGVLVLALPLIQQVADDLDTHRVTLTATWSGVRPTHYIFAVDGHEIAQPTRNIKKKDSVSITVTDHVGATYAVEVYVEEGIPLPRDPVYGDATYGCAISYGDGRPPVTRASMRPGGVRCTG